MAQTLWKCSQNCCGRKGKMDERKRFPEPPSRGLKSLENSYIMNGNLIFNLYYFCDTHKTDYTHYLSLNCILIDFFILRKFSINYVTFSWIRTLWLLNISKTSHKDKSAFNNKNGKYTFTRKCPHKTRYVVKIGTLLERKLS